MKTKKIIFVIIILLILAGAYVFYSQLTKNTLNDLKYLKKCCQEKYNGEILYNDCLNNECIYDTQFGYNCRFNSNGGTSSIPVKLMKC